MTGSGWRWLRPVVAVAVLAVLIWRLGTGPIVRGLDSLNVWAVLAASVLNAVATTAAAVRWRSIANALGVGLGLRTAVADYYRAQFLNVVLPGGVVGDVHRAVRHGRDGSDFARGARSVMWERASGAVVQLAGATLVLLVVPSPFGGPAVLAASAGIVLVGLGAFWARRHGGVMAELRTGVLGRRQWPVVLGTSSVVVVAHALVFAVAARAADARLGAGALCAVTMVVLLASSVPVNLGGWGPREGAAAAAFAAVGGSASTGLAVATGYGVLVMLSALPGSLVLLLARHRAAPPPAGPKRRDRVGAAAHG